MLTQKVENDEVVVAVLTLKFVVILEQIFVKLVQLGVAGVELCRTQLRIVQEESATEVVHRLTGFR